ncbi:hypothetical protein AcW1_009342 [Taiwanofungus camphoratus]|nr:hypothetical protein AcV7_003975 [Antrodia cinnamomea]KAI0947635.1 hypothetical protein AcW1_009342 [Antrodia cinnamomea]
MSDNSESAFTWRTVYLTTGEQVIDISEKLLSHGRTAPPPPVTNLWVGARDRLQGFGSTACRRVADQVAQAGLIDNLAVDVNLLAEGWLSRRAVRPKQVILLMPKNLTDIIKSNLRLKLFDCVTHLIVEPPWYRICDALEDENRPLKDFKALTHLCIQFPAGADPSLVIRLMKNLITVTTLERLVVCLDTGFLASCPVDNPVWNELKTLTKDLPHVAVLTRPKAMEIEWNAIVNDGRTIWDKAEDPEEQMPGPPMTQEDWTRLTGALSGKYLGLRWDGVVKTTLDEPAVKTESEAIDPDDDPDDMTWLTRIPEYKLFAEEAGVKP